MEQVAGDAREAVDYADQINNQNKLYVDNTIEEYKQYADMKLEESAEKALQAGESARMAQQSETTAIEMAEEAGKKAEEAGRKAEEAWKSAEDSKGYAEQCAGVAGFDGTASTVSAIDTQGIAVRKASGTVHVTIENAAEHPILNLNLAGKSEQVSTTGAQLLDLSAINKSVAGAVVNYADGGYSISGTGALTDSFTASQILDIKNALQPGNLILKSELTIPKLYVRIWDGNTVLAEMQGNSTKQITQEMIDNDNVRVECFLYGNTGSTITPGTYHPMLYQSGDGTWEPYTGGNPSPSPDYPQPIISTGTVTTGAQLLVYPFYNTTKTQNGITFTALDDGRVSIKGTVTGNNATYILQQNLILPPGTYTKNNLGTIKYMISRYLNGAFDRVEVSQNDVTFDTDGWDYDVYEYKPLLQTVTVGDTFNNLIVSPMLSAGATPKPWEPYTGGKPSPSEEYPQPLDVTVTGAQLLDMTQAKGGTNGGITIVINDDGSYTCTGTATESTINIWFLGKYIEEAPTLFILEKGTYYKSGIRLFNGRKTIGPIFDGEFTLAEDTPITGVRALQLEAGKTYSNYTVYPMINAGPTAQPWQPYQSCTATISLTEPLRGIGDVRDRIMCKDGVWGIERMIGIVDNDAWKQNNMQSGTAGNRFLYTAEDIKKVQPITVYCTKYTQRNVESYNISGDYIATDETHANNRINIRTLEKDFETVDAFKVFMADAMTIYPLATPTWEPLPSATQSALNALTTYTGTTHVTITAGGAEPDVGLEYFGQPGDKVTVQDMCDSFAAPGFDDSGVVQGISGFGDFLNRMTSGMRLPSFFRDLKAGLKFVLHTGQLVNNGLCNEPGKYPLDAAYGRTLLEMIGNTANLPGGAADIVSAIVTQNSNLSDKTNTSDFNNLKNSIIMVNVTGFSIGIDGNNVIIQWLTGENREFGYALNIGTTDGTMQFFYRENGTWKPSWNK